MLLIQCTLYESVFIRRPPYKASNANLYIFLRITKIIIAKTAKTLNSNSSRIHSFIYFWMLIPSHATSRHVRVLLFDTIERASPSQYHLIAKLIRLNEMWATM